MLSSRRTSSWLGLIPFLAAVTAVAVVGGLAAGSAGQTYRTLELPPFAPPSWLFGPVWTVLYVLIAVAGWLVWRERGWDRSLTLWSVQLVLNLLWTPLFFAADLYVAALVDIVLLLVAVAATIALFRRTSPLAAWLLVPYLVWVAFATVLTLSIVVLN
ncbi:MAG: TspO/MBR family protein [Nocardioides sp.]